MNVETLKTILEKADPESRVLVHVGDRMIGGTWCNPVEAKVDAAGQLILEVKPVGA